MNKKKLFEKILHGGKNVWFGDMVTLIEAFGFRLSRTKGSHHLFVHSTVKEVLNLQNVNGQAKPYQIKQFLRLVEQNNLKMRGEE